MDHIFLQTLQERFSDFKKAVDQYLMDAPNGNLEQHVANATKVEKIARDLSDILPSTGTPPWIPSLLQQARTFIANNNAGHARSLNHYLAKNYHTFQPIVLNESDALPRFDELFDEILGAGQIPELFDLMAEQLEEIIKSNKLDSMTVLTTLQRLIQLLRAIRDGSHTSIFTVRFAMKLLNNAVRATVEKVPGVKVYWTTYEEHHREFEKEYKESQAEYQRQAMSRILEDTERERIQRLEMDPDTKSAIEAVFTPLALIESSMQEIPEEDGNTSTKAS